MDFQDIPRDYIEGLIKEMVSTYVSKRAEDLRVGWWDNGCRAVTTKVVEFRDPDEEDKMKQTKSQEKPSEESDFKKKREAIVIPNPNMIVDDNLKILMSIWAERDLSRQGRFYMGQSVLMYDHSAGNTLNCSRYVINCTAEFLIDYLNNFPDMDDLVTNFYDFCTCLHNELHKGE